MQHCFRDISAQAPVLGCFPTRFQEFVRHHFICFYLMMARSALFTIRLWHFYGSEWLLFFFFFLSRSCETRMCCINTTRRLGVAQFRCSAFDTATLHATHLPYQWVPPSHLVLLQRGMKGKGIFLRGTGNLWEEPGIRDLVIHDCCMSHLTHLLPDSHDRSKIFILTGR